MPEIKDSLLYTENHVWIKVGEETGIIGITDYAQEQLGEIVYIELPEIGENIFVGNTFASIESVKTVSELIAPVNGNITAVNKKLSTTPDLINKDPFNKGWLIKIKIGEIEQLKSLIPPGAYEDLTRE